MISFKKFLLENENTERGFVETIRTNPRDSFNYKIFADFLEEKETDEHFVANMRTYANSLENSRNIMDLYRLTLETGGNRNFILDFHTRFPRIRLAMIPSPLNNQERTEIINQIVPNPNKTITFQQDFHAVVSIPDNNTYGFDFYFLGSSEDDKVVNVGIEEVTLWGMPTPFQRNITTIRNNVYDPLRRLINLMT